MKNFRSEAKRIISRMNTGKEINYKGFDYLYYGMGLYGFSDDVILSGCEYTNGNNGLFKHIVPTVENVVRYLTFIESQIIRL